MTDITSTITYRLLRDVDSLRQVVKLQKLVWGEDPEGQVPLNMLYSLAANGAPIIGAYDGELLVGFSLAFFGTSIPDSPRPAMANLKLASKRLAVHPDYRSAGIGYQLKLEQKAFAHQQGIRLITWTFDPLISRNAYFHIHKLGSLGREFHIDYYDQIIGQVDTIGTSDRMICEWWVTSNRVEERLHGNRRALTLKQYLEADTPLVNPTILTSDGQVMPGEGSYTFEDHHLLLVEIPADYDLCFSDPAVALSWREHTRSVFGAVFGAGYIATDFLHEEYQGRQRSFYVFGFDGLGQE
jgi:predicted GNAT superfamily acetyltransferase